MKEVTLEIGRAYLLDRVKELRNQVPNGDPFVFFGASSLMWALGNLDTERKIVPVFYSKNGGMDALFRTFQAIAMYNFSLEGTDVELTHDDSLHLTVKSNGRTVYSASKTLDFVEESINALFDACEDDKVLASWVYFKLNTEKFIGLRD